MPIHTFGAATPRMLALIGSVCLSLWVWMGGTSINTDGVVYLETALAYGSHGLTAATKIYNLPFYSILIAYVAKLGLSLEAAAHLLNVLFFATISFTFVSIIETIYPQSRRSHYLASIIILLLPRLNFMRESFFRDNGYVAFLLLSLLAIIHFSKTHRPLWFAAWAGSLTISALFRPEAVLFFVAGPAILLSSHRSKKSYLSAISLLLGIAATALFIIFKTQPVDHHSPSFWLDYYTTDFVSEFNNATEIIATSVLSEFSKDYAQEGVIAVLITVLIGTVINTLTPIYSLTLWLTRKAKPSLATLDKKILFYYALCAIIPPILFILKFRFLTSRYVLAFVLIALLIIPTRLVLLIESIRPGFRRATVIAVIWLFFAIKNLRELSIDTLQRDAGRWLSHTQESVWTNNLAISFYARGADSAKPGDIAHGREWQENEAELKKYDHIALLLNRNEAKNISSFIEKTQGAEEKRFEGSSRIVVIIKTSNQTD